MKYIAIALAVLILVILTFCNRIKVDVKRLSHPKKGIRPIEFNIPEILDGYKAYNASIVESDGEYKLYVRLSNFVSCDWLETQKNFVKFFLEGFKSYLLVCRLDRDFNVISMEMINQSHKQYSVEDVRAFKWAGKTWFISSILMNGWDDEVKPENPHKFCPAISADCVNWKELHMRGDEPFQKTEKNWSPLVVNNRLYLIQNHNPLVILEPDVESGVCDVIYRGEIREDIPRLRGNTPYIPLGDGRYLGLTHTTDGNVVVGKDYTHYFVILDPTVPCIESVSKSMCFNGNCGIEFAMGLIETIEKDSYVVTFGVKDCSSHAVIIPKEKLLELF